MCERLDYEHTLNMLNRFTQIQLHPYLDMSGQVKCCFVPLCSAPRPVQSLSIRHSSETSLSAAWNRPVGDWDNYTVLLGDGDTTVDRRTLDHDVQQCSFNSLTPGHTYTITVTVNSGDLSSSAHATGNTSESFRRPVWSFIEL